VVGEEPLEVPAGLNDLHREQRLTMGGVADLPGVALGLLVVGGGLGAS
jgi:hypothetical protein